MIRDETDTQNITDVLRETMADSFSVATCGRKLINMQLGRLRQMMLLMDFWKQDRKALKTWPHVEEQ